MACWPSTTDKRDLKCACAKGDSKVPLKFVSLLQKYHDDIDGYLAAHKLVMRFMLSFHQLDAVLMLLKGKFMQIAIILLQHSRNRRFASIIC